MSVRGESESEAGRDTVTCHTGQTLGEKDVRVGVNCDAVNVALRALHNICSAPRGRLINTSVMRLEIAGIRLELSSRVKRLRSPLPPTPLKQVLHASSR